MKEDISGTNTNENLRSVLSDKEIMQSAITRVEAVNPSLPRKEIVSKTRELMCNAWGEAATEVLGTSKRGYVPFIAVVLAGFGLAAACFKNGQIDRLPGMISALAIVLGSFGNVGVLMNAKESARDKHINAQLDESGKSDPEAPGDARIKSRVPYYFDRQIEAFEEKVAQDRCESASADIAREELPKKDGDSLRALLQKNYPDKSEEEIWEEAKFEIRESVFSAKTYAGLDANKEEVKREAKRNLKDFQTGIWEKLTL